MKIEWKKLKIEKLEVKVIQSTVKLRMPQRYISSSERNCNTENRIYKTSSNNQDQSMPCLLVGPVIEMYIRNECKTSYLKCLEMNGQLRVLIRIYVNAIKNLNFNSFCFYYLCGYSLLQKR